MNIDLIDRLERARAIVYRIKDDFDAMTTDDLTALDEVLAEARLALIGEDLARQHREGQYREYIEKLVDGLRLDFAGKPALPLEDICAEVNRRVEEGAYMRDPRLRADVLNAPRPLEAETDDDLIASLILGDVLTLLRGDSA